MGIALTNLHLRVITWQKEKPKNILGIVKSLALQPILTAPIPVMASETTLPLSHVSDHAVSRRRNDLSVMRTIFKTDPGDLVTLMVRVGSVAHEFTSPFTDFDSLVGKLRAVLAGEQLANRTVGVSDAITKLAALRRDGILTDEEFERAKGGLLGADVSVAESSASQLRQLHSLTQSGVLTESEFRMKKWDILSRPG